MARMLKFHDEVCTIDYDNQIETEDAHKNKIKTQFPLKQRVKSQIKFDQSHLLFYIGSM